MAGDGRSELPRAAAWLMQHRGLALEELLAGLAAELRAEGVAVVRASAAVHTHHPEVHGRNVEWTLASGSRIKLHRHALLATPAYLESPVAAIQRGAGPIRRRLAGPDAQLDYAICRELAAAGLTDYLALPIELADGRRTMMSWAADRPGGFTDGEVAALEAVAPYFAWYLEAESARYALRSLLEVYLGHNAALRVAAGAFRRGGGERLHAAIFYCDLRGFTTLADQRPVDEVIATLNDYFEAVGGPLVEEGGEILKLIGDALLAVFLVDERGPGAACARALGAAERAVAAVTALPVPLRIGVALHLGEVMYGNIGARERLDFTVVGAAVNEACRVEALCKTLEVPLLLSAPFQAALARAGSPLAAQVVSTGQHTLRGVREPQELFTLVRYRR